MTQEKARKVDIYTVFVKAKVIRIEINWKVESKKFCIKIAAFLFKCRKCVRFWTYNNQKSCPDS